MPQGGIARRDAARAALRELKEEIGTDKAEFLAKAAQWLRYEVRRAPPPRLERALSRQVQKCSPLRFTGEDGDIDLASRHPEFNA